MNISILSTYSNEGGAGIAAHRLYRGLKQAGHNTVMIVRDKGTHDKEIYEVKPEAPEFDVERMIFQFMQKSGISQNRTDLSNTWFSIPYPGYDLSKTQLIADSDIINLHWISGFQSVESIANILKTGKPVVWTLHDENPYTGGCHYTAGCAKYEEDCRDCLQLNNNRLQIPFHNLSNKVNLWNKDITVITPSKWLAGRAKKSKVFKDCRVEVIPNSLETDIFKPIAKNLAKKKVGLDSQTFTILVGAYSSNEKRKGFHKFIEVIKYCMQDKNFKDMVDRGGINFLTFGPLQKDMEGLDIKIKSAGYLNDNEKLSVIYSAADVFVLPSLEDNLPNTMIEAMACGTPVVSFEVGGMPDMIQNGVTGFMAPCFDIRKLGDFVLELFDNENVRVQININCRQLIEGKFKLYNQTENYLDLFNDLVEKGSPKIKSEKNKERNSIGESIILEKWESDVQEYFFEAYRLGAISLIERIDKRNQIRNEVLRHDDLLFKKRLKDFFYRIGRLIGSFF